MIYQMLLQVINKQRRILLIWCSVW